MMNQKPRRDMDDEDESSAFRDADEIWVQEITPDSAIEFHDRINRQFKMNPRLPITININSPGGDVAAMFQMFDSMDAITACAPKEFYFITMVSGEACSAAADLLAYGDLRIATPKSTVMIHQTSGWPRSPHVDDMRVHADELERMNDLAMQIFVDNTGFPGGLEGLKNYLKRDKWLSAKEAKELGVVDEIGYMKIEYAKAAFVHIFDEVKKDRKGKKKYRQVLTDENEEKEAPAKKSKAKPKRGVKK